MKHKRGGCPQDWLAAAACVLAAGQALLVFASWLVGALAPEAGLRSLLDGEGIRWFFARFCAVVGGWPLVWLLLTAVALGCAGRSGLAEACCHPRSRSLRERSALTVAAFFLIIYIGVLAVLALPRRAVLAGLDGSLWPSPLSASLVPALAFGVCVCAVVYGVVAGRLASVREVFASLHAGIAGAAPWLLLYVLLAQLAASVGYVLGGAGLG